MAPQTQQNGVRTVEDRVAALEDDNAQIRADVLTLAGQQATGLREVNGKLDALLAASEERKAADVRKSQEDAEQDARIVRLEQASTKAAAAAPKIEAAAASVQSATIQAEAATAALGAVADKLPPGSKLRAWLPVIALIVLALVDRFARGGH